MAASLSMAPALQRGAACGRCRIAADSERLAPLRTSDVSAGFSLPQNFVSGLDLKKGKNPGRSATCVEPQQGFSRRNLKRAGKCLASFSVDAMAEAVPSRTINPGNVSILINGGSGKMGRAVAEEAVSSGLNLVPFALAGPNIPVETINIQGIDVEVYPLEERDRILDLALEKHPNLIIVDYTLPAGVNDNAEWYCQRKVPFVMGTTGGDRQRLLSFVRDSDNYAVIAPQMGKQVVAFLAAMEYLAENFPGAYSGYSLTAFESHQSSKVDVSGTAKEVVSSFQKLGIDFSFDQIRLVRDKKEQVEVMNVPEEYLNGHAFHTYRIASPDKTVSFEFQHNVCGRNIYAQGTVDAVLFLAKKIHDKSEQKLFNMIDVLKGGAMR